MRITDLLSRQSIELNASPMDKQEALNQAVDLLNASGKIEDRSLFIEAVLKREEEGSTGIGEGIAIPHAKTKATKETGLALMIIPQGVEFDSLDGEKVKVLFLIGASEGKNEAHLEILSELSGLLMDSDFVKKLENAKSVDEVYMILDEAQSNEVNQEKEENNEIPKILAVTACPTGIAHTYMAAQALKDKAEDLGIAIKVETRGSSGVKNELSAEDILQADYVIVAADTQVPLERFGGKRVLFVKVADGISRPEELIQQVKNAPIYQAIKQDENLKEQNTQLSLGHTLYKHLMNGVSYMLPFVVGGGLLIAIAFLIDGYFIDMQNASDGVKKAFGSNTELAKFFMQTGGMAFDFMLPILAGFIALSIADRPALLVGFVGGAIAKSGGSGFLGAILAGFLAGYLVVLLKQVFSKLPTSLDGLKPILFYPFFGLLCIAILMIFVINPPVSYLNSALNEGLNSMSGEWKVALGLLLGGMMATDLGGPINKAAYVFGVASIASGNYDIMASVMVGGMVPPLAIALSTVLFKNKFTQQERNGGLANFVMGLSFITEGAIPFAAADPLRVLGACIVGSSLAGGLSMYFGCTLMAPHGGIFVFPVVGGVFYYLVSLMAGTLVGALLLGIFKKGVQQ